LENLAHNLVKLFWRTVEEASKPGQADLRLASWPCGGGRTDCWCDATASRVAGWTAEHPSSRPRHHTDLPLEVRWPHHGRLATGCMRQRHVEALHFRGAAQEGGALWP
jgi:hypothetical protein